MTKKITNDEIKTWAENEGLKLLSSFNFDMFRQDIKEFAKISPEVDPREIAQVWIVNIFANEDIEHYLKEFTYCNCNEDGTELNEAFACVDRGLGGKIGICKRCLRGLIHINIESGAFPKSEYDVLRKLALEGLE